MLTQKQKTRFTTRILNDDRLDSFTLTARGRSMRPLLKDGMEIQLRKIGPGRQPAVGDVAAVRYRNGLLVHRIVLARGRKNDREYFTKGDWRLAGDGWWKQEQILAIRETKTIWKIVVNYLFAVISLLTLLIGAGLRNSRIRRG